MYKYHRLGLDIMNDKADDGRKEILKSMDYLLVFIKTDLHHLQWNYFLMLRSD
jgi:hypothetical protein